MTVELNTRSAAVKTAYELNANTNAFTDAEQTKLAGTETGATADQTDAEIKTAYQAAVPLISQAAAEAGTATGIESWSALRVAQAIAALASGSGAFTADANTQITPSVAIVLDQATGDEVALDLSFTVNKAAGNYTGIRLNAIETSAPGADDRLVDLRKGGVSMVYINNLAQIYALGAIQSENGFRAKHNSLTIPAFSAGSAEDTMIFRDAANIFAQRNSANAQTSRIYGDYASTTDYQRCGIVTTRTATTVPSAATFTLSGFIPAGAFLIGITSRVDTTCTTATGYTVGDGVDADLWGVATSVTLNAAGAATASVNFTAAGASGVLYTAAQDVVVTATGGSFDGTGVITVCAHYLITEAD